MIFGQAHPGPTPAAVNVDRILTAPITPGERVVLSALKLYCDGRGGGAGPALIRGVLYDAADNLVALGREQVLVPASGVGWRDLPMTDFAGLELVAGTTYRAGAHFGGGDLTARVFVNDPGVPASSEATDTYGDGTAAVLPAQTPLTTDLPVVLAAFLPYQPPDTDAVDDDYLASLPWDQAQVAFTGGALAAAGRSVSVGWHGRDFDERVGAIAIVREDGPLSDLVGERVRVSCRVGITTPAIFVYVTDELDFGDEASDEAMSLPRDTFSKLAALTSDTITATVEVLA